MAEEKEIVLKISAETNEAILERFGSVLDEVLGTYDENIEQLQRYNAQIKANEEVIKQITKATGTERQALVAQYGTVTELTKAVRADKMARQQLMPIIKEQEKHQLALGDIYKQSSSLLNLMKTAFRGMTQEQLKANKDLVPTIDALDKSIKNADASIGNFQRNVGNYPKLVQQIVGQVPGLNRVASAFSSITSAGSVVGGVIGVVGLAVTATVSAIKSYNTAIAGSAELTYQLRDAMVEADATSDLLTRRLQSTAGVFISLKGGISSVIAAVKREVFKFLETTITVTSTFFDNLSKGNFKEAFVSLWTIPQTIDAQYKQQQDEIEEIIEKINDKQERLDKLRERSVVRIAELEAKAAEELLKSRDKERYSEQERYDAATRYEDLTKERIGILKQIAVLERDIAILEGERSDNTHEVNMNIERAKASIAALERQESEALRRVAEVRGTISKQIENEEKQAAKVWQDFDKAVSQASTVKPVTIKTKLDTKSAIADLKTIEQELDEELSQVQGGVLGGGTSALAVALGISDSELETIKSSAISAAQSIFNSIQQLSQEATQRRLDDELKALDDQTNTEKAKLKARYESGALSRKQYEQKLEEIDAAAEAKREELQKEAFEKNKRWNILSALMNAALAITNIWAQHAGNPIVAGILTALTAATTAAQVAVIASQKYAKGGLLRGASHENGGIKGHIEGQNFEVEGGEYVVRKKVTRKHLPFLNWFNANGDKYSTEQVRTRFAPAFGTRRFAKGGVLGSYDFTPAAVPQSTVSVVRSINAQTDELKRYVDATNRRIDRLTVRVLTSAIEDAIDTKNLHISRAEM